MRTVMLATFAITTALASLGSLGQEARTEEVHISAERFSFTPSEIRTTTGTTLRITLQSDDTSHGFRIIGSDVDIEIPKRGRGETTVTFTPDKAGRYTFECSRLCGAGHSFMRGTIVVTDPEANQP
jgi:cytochrome c oxidase subunit 2